MTRRPTGQEPAEGVSTDGSRVARRPSRRADDTPVLPDRAGEDRPESWGERPDPEGADDERYLRERPPHW